MLTVPPGIFSFKLLQRLGFVVLITLFCYPAVVCAHPQKPESADADPPAERLTIELSQVDNLDRVARFTQLLAEQPRLSDLRLERVGLQVGQPERSLVRWTAQLAAGTLDEFEAALLTAANQVDGLALVHRRSHRGFLGLALHPAGKDHRLEGEDDIPSPRCTAWSVRSGLGFD